MRTVSNFFSWEHFRFIQYNGGYILKAEYSNSYLKVHNRGHRGHVRMDGTTESDATKFYFYSGPLDDKIYIGRPTSSVLIPEFLSSEQNGVYVSWYLRHKKSWEAWEIIQL